MARSIYCCSVVLCEEERFDSGQTMPVSLHSGGAEATNAAQVCQGQALRVLRFASQP